MTFSEVKRLGIRFNSVFERFMFIIIPSSMVVGYLCSIWLQSLSSWVVYLFAYITFVMALGCNIQSIQAATRNRAAMILIFFVSHIISPWIAYYIGLWVFGNGSPYIIGMVLFAAIPLGISSIIWVNLSNGNIAFMLSMVVIDTLISPFLVPLIVSYFFGTTIQFEYIQMMQDLIWMIVLPTILGILLNQWLHKVVKEYVQPIAVPITKLAFVMVVMINVAVITPYVTQLGSDMVKVIPISLLLVLICYVLGFISSFIFKNDALTVTLTYASGMRNISLGIVIALQYFGPLAAVPVVMAILIQQPFATLNHWFMRWYLNLERNE